MKSFTEWASKQSANNKKLLDHISAGELTPDEAAMIAAGWEAKNPNPSRARSPESALKSYKLLFHSHTGTATPSMF
jgi:hypothetical protein